MRCAAIIVAAGSSRRMGFDKLAAPLAGVPVLRRSVELMMRLPEVGRVVVVCPPERFDALLKPPFPKPLSRVDGGHERQDSVRAGLDALEAGEDLVAIHDGARPLARPEDIARCIAQASRTGAATLARPVAETLKLADEQGDTVRGVDRSNLWIMETPQVFRTSTLCEAYRHVAERNLVVTDEVSVLEAAGIPTRLVPSSGPNPKVTVPADIMLAEALLRT